MDSTTRTPQKRGRKKGYKKPPPTLSPADTVIRPVQLPLAVGFTNSTALRLEKKGEFPQRRKLTPGGSAGWLREEIEAWKQSRTSQI